MPFSSLFFLHGFLPVFLVAYWLTPRRHANLTAVVGSLLFYAWGAPRFLPVLCAFAVVDHVLGRAIASWREQASTRMRAKFCLSVGVVGHLALLGYFKYANFFVAQSNELRARMGLGAIAWTDVILPIGISFITFEAISYLVDVYRGDAKPARRWSDYALFLTLFPHSIAGPIFRWKDLDGQLRDRTATHESILRGAERFTLGLAKKVLLADTVAITADAIFGLPWDQLSPGLAWAGAIAYTLQIYFDFSGYSDMAIGLGAMMGFTFKENFRQPYLSESLTEFWQRWHISLSSWLRDYLYIPLGGNRGGESRALRNVFIVFAVSGFWHGAAWTFIAWGAFHGLFVVAERAFAKQRARIPGAVGQLLTLLLVVVGWVFFRAATLGHALSYLRAMAGRGATHSLTLLPGFIFPNIAILALVAGTALVLLPRWVPMMRVNDADARSASGPMRWAYVLLFVFSSIHLVSVGTAPLIYFKF